MLKDTSSGAFYDTKEIDYGNVIDFVFVALGMTPNDLTCVNLQLVNDPDSCRNESFEFRGEVAWNPIEKEENVEVEEDGYGGETLINKFTRQIHSFSCVMDERDYTVLYRIMGLEETVQLNRVNNGSVLESDKVENISVEGQQILHNIYEVTVSFEVRSQGNGGTEKMAFGTNGCCLPLYESAPFEDPCDPGSGTGGAECELYAVAVTESGGNLTASVSNGDGSQIQYQWFYKEPGGVFELLANNASTVSLGGFGTYKVIATQGNCNDNDSYVYLDPCAGFAVSLSQSGDNLTANVENAGSGLTYSWEYNDGTGWSDLVDTTQTIIASDLGTYRVTVNNDALCEDEAIITVTAESGCAELTIGIDNTDGELSLTGLEGNTPTTVTWNLDEGTGYVEVDTGLTTEATGNGLYQAVIDIDGCLYTAQLLILNIECDPCDAITINIVEDAGVLTAVTSGCTGTEQIDWYLNAGSGYQHVGSGSTFTPSTDGLYRANVKCDDCEKMDYIFYCGGEFVEGGQNNWRYYTVFKTTGTTITTPEVPSEIIAVFRDSVRLIEGGASNGYTFTTPDITLSEPPFTNNPAGGQEYLVIYKV